MKIKMQNGEFAKVPRYGKYPVLHYQHGYLWVGNDHPDNMACYATVDGKKLKKLCEHILNDLKNR